MSDQVRYRLAKRTQGSPEVPPQLPNTSEYTYVASALDIALSLLSTDQAKNAMVELVKLFDHNLSEFPRIFQGATDAVVKSHINAFVEILQQQTPLIVLDGELTDPRIPAYHPRGIWDGNFDVQLQAICLNQKLVESMVSSSSSQREFRRYQFLFAHLLFHEIGGHLLITYLYNGRPVTPRGVIAPNWNSQEQEEHGAQAGESGRFLESMLFGGTLEFFDSPQVSSPWIVNDIGSAKAVTTAAIDATVVNRQFDLPYPTQNPEVDVTSLLSTHRRLEVSWPAESLNRQFILRAIAQPRRFFISRSNLRLVPNNSTILAQAT
ncbi:hypothetical protein AJ78_08343 [Emergomyces pasteurianus Ep9510]|uniref:Uncharacterized protein n=1 Tax=Emergomyces pasteurianus Ep9510 TaxID=1447872 RepID=A0A1J9Q6E3_9EURO|nr:hypothetical protein AJ78_08343 [Emergomyces pasteurianus Ep9510]